MKQCGLIANVFLLLVATNAIAVTNDEVDWQPTVSEKLIRMPAKYLDETIERNFQQSSLASAIHALDTQIDLEVLRMKESHQTVADMDINNDEHTKEMRYQFLTAKSNYLGLLHEKQQLKATWARPGTPLFSAINRRLNLPLQRECHLLALLQRAEISCRDIAEIAQPITAECDPVILEQIEIQIKYTI